MSETKQHLFQYFFAGTSATRPMQELCDVRIYDCKQLLLGSKAGESSLTGESGSSSLYSRTVSSNSETLKKLLKKYGLIHASGLLLLHRDGATGADAEPILGPAEAQPENSVQAK